MLKNHLSRCQVGKGHPRTEADLLKEPHLWFPSSEYLRQAAVHKSKVFGLAGVLLALIGAGCDIVAPGGDEEERSRIEERLVGTWRLEAQATADLIVAAEPQTILDPDAQREGDLTLSGPWGMNIRRSLRYARHAAIETYDGVGRAVLLSTRPVRAGAAVQGPRRGIAVEIRDAYDTEADRYQSDGYLEGELLSAPAENRPGRPTLPAGSLAARPLPRVPFSSDVRTRLDLPFTRPAARDDTLRVRGMLRPQTTRLPAGREVVADRDGTPSARFREQRVTYEFSEDGSVRVYALAEDDPTAVKGPGRRGHLEGACPHSGS